MAQAAESGRVSSSPSPSIPTKYRFENRSTRTGLVVGARGRHSIRGIVEMFASASTSITEVFMVEVREGVCVTCYKNQFYSSEDNSRTRIGWMGFTRLRRFLKHPFRTFRSYS